MVVAVNPLPLPRSVRRHGCQRRVAVAALAIAACLGQAGRGEDDRIVDDAELALLEAGPNAAQINNGQIVDLESQFDTNVLSQLGNGVVFHGQRVVDVHKGRRGGKFRGPVGAAIDGQPQPSGTTKAAQESPVVTGMRSSAEPAMTQIESLCKPSADQTRLLHLALERDVQRVAEQINRVRRKYAGVRLNLQEQQGQQKWQQFHQDLQTCQQLLLDFVRGRDGLFGKVQATVLAGEQYTRLETELDASRAQRWQAFVALALGRWDHLLALDQRQHDDLEKLLLQKRPPLRVGGGFNPNMHGNAFSQQAQWLVPLALADVGEQRIRAVVNERQWKVLQRMMLQAKQMRPHLEQTGILETAGR